MALKFLNKKGWHTGSLRNIENVWKAEQKHEAEERKLEELKKQIHEERERAEFRQLQEQAGLISGQERLEFLYDSGLAVGKSSGFKALESAPKAEPEAAASSSTAAKPQSASLGALFEEDKPQSANDAWRKLTFDPLLSIRRSEQESLARIKNNPIQMDMIRKSVEAKKKKGKDEKKHKKKHHRKKSEHKMNASSDNDSEDASLTVEKHRESRHHKGSRSESEKHTGKRTHASDDETRERDTRRRKYYDEYKDRRPSGSPNRRYNKVDDHRKKSERKMNSSSDNDSEGASLTDEKHRQGRHHKDSRSETEKHTSKRTHASDDETREGDTRRKKYYDEYKDRRPSSSPSRKVDKVDDDYKSKSYDYRKKEYSSERQIDSHKKEYSSERQLDSRPEKRSYPSSSVKPPRHESNNRHRNIVKLSEEERAAKLKEMQMDALRHEEQRWKRLKKAEEVDAQEAVYDQASAGRNFLDATQKSVYGAEKGGSSTIEESVRRRTHYSQRRSDSESNAFRRA